MIIDGLIGSSAIDSSGEILNIEGCDISSVEEGNAYANFEHKSGDGGTSLDIVGKIVFCHKIFKASDCENPRQLQYWKGIELPCIYAVIRLTDEAGHPGAVALAASIRDELKNEGKVTISYSVEGSTLKREGQHLLKTVIRGCAITYRPCNKSVRTGILADPAAPPGFEKKPYKEKSDDVDWLESFAESRKSDRSPDRTVLGYHVNTFIPLSDELQKTITAGSYNAAPGSLLGGAALQVEDQGLRKRHLINQARAALRDWNKSEPFKSFLKHRLPDADDSFVDRFADMVSDYQLKKAQAAKAGKPQAEIFSAPEFGEGQLTIRGKPLPPRPNVEKPHFDETTGTLHTPRGSFPMYIPGRDPDPRMREAFHNTMNDAAASKVHAYALKNWKKAHQLLATGKLPEAVIMHANLFSNLSPNTPVPNQELMYGHLVDTMRQQGIDARDPRFGTIKQHWMNRDNPDTYPEQSRAHYQRFDDQLRIQNDSKLTGRKAGDIGGFMLANDKFQNMSEYHKMHPGMVDLVRRHGIDAQAGVRELMQHKNARQLWEAKRKRAKTQGKLDPGEFGGIHIKGLAPKTARYMYGMMGGGNVSVPDTHFVRYLFGLEKNKDTPSIDYVKSLLWNENNADILDAIDRHYVKHHDAVKHMAEHPDIKGSGIAPEHLAFPAFWRNWMAIVPHEQARGMRTGGHNEHTDHRPFWEAIGEYLDNRQVQKHEQDAWSRALDMVKEHLHWQETLGELPAQMMYFAYLLPRLLGARADEDGVDEAPAKHLTDADPNGNVDLVCKFESWAVNMSVAAEQLRKAVPEHKSPAKKKALDSVSFQGKTVKPGVIHLMQRIPGDPRSYAVIGHDKTHFHVIPTEDPGGAIGAEDLHKVTKLSKSPRREAYTVTRWPEELSSGKIVDADIHGDKSYNTGPEQKKLIQGLDFGADPIQGDERGGHWRKSPGAGSVYIKGESGPNASGFSGPRREVAAYRLAKDVFGLGDMLPMKALFKHPRTSQEMVAIGKVPGAEHYGSSPKDAQALMELGARGDLDKAAMMDWVLGTYDSHHGNWMMAKDKKGNPGLRLIDHEDSFSSDPNMRMELPDYLDAQNRLVDRSEWHPGAQDWIQTIKPSRLMQEMKALGIPEQHTYAAASRLNFLQHGAREAQRQGRRYRLDEVFGALPGIG